MKMPTIIIDEEEYYIVGKVALNSNRYYCLISTIDSEKFIVRKLENIDDKEYLSGLKDEEEFNSVLNEYLKSINSK